VRVGAGPECAGCRRYVSFFCLITCSGDGMTKRVTS
jgi:hypothetical protein